MNKLGFLFFVLLYILLSIFASAKSIDFSVQLTGCIFLIGLVGIPHGAIDHILFQESQGIKSQYFYLFYFGMMGVYLAGWLVFAKISLILFLINSSYHFGQSQFNDISGSSKSVQVLLHFFWGCSILSGLIYYNNTELTRLFSTQEDLNALLIVFNPSIHMFILPFSSLAVIFILLKYYWNKTIGAERALREIYMLAIIHFCFYTLPVLVGFTLYFVVLHSFKVLTEEYKFLQSKKQGFSLRQFVFILFPFTILSLFGCIVLLYLCRLEWLNISFAFLILILISILTLPHSIVMELFYRKYSRVLKSQ